MNLEDHIKRQMAFSRATFGPAERRDGVCDHIAKELQEVSTAPDAGEAAKEWVDVVILGLDGLWRALASAKVHPQDIAWQAVKMIEDKQTRNELRNWPDWRTAPENKAIEHIRGGANG